MHVLLLTDVPPCTNYTAGLVQKQLCDFLFEENYKVTCVSIVDSSLSPIIPTTISDRLEHYYQFRKPKEGYGRSKFGKINSFLFNNYNRKLVLPKIAKEISNVISLNNEKIDLIWSVIQGQTMICLVPLVAKLLKLDYVVQIWDPPEWWLNENCFDPYSYRVVMNEFASLLEGSKCCLAASHNMAEHYKKIFKVKCMPVIPSLSSDKKFVEKRNLKKEIHIAYSGQIYARDAFLSFVKALDSINWKCEGKTIILDIFTDYIDPNFIKKYPNIHTYGWIPQDILLDKLSSMDLTYCPYRFDEEFEIIARLSFPSKLTSYLKTSVPVLIHAPKYSSISNFISDGKTGYICNSLDITILAKKIKSILCDSNRDNVGIRGNKLFLEFLTIETMKKSFFMALGLEGANDEGNTNK